MNRAYFFARVREAVFGGKLSKQQVEGMTYLLDVWDDRYSECDYRWLAYCLATAKHETAHKMMPVPEIGKGRGRKYGVPTGRYKKVYYGRGHVQLTWEKNYRTMSKYVGEDLVQFPEKALDPAISATVLYEGMMRGLFTGKKLSDYIDGDRCDFEGARRIVNGTDRAKLIAGYAYAFADAINQAKEEPDEDDDEYISGDQTTGTPVEKSKTIWAQIASMFSVMGGAVWGFLKSIDPWVIVALAVLAVVAFGIWTISERIKHAREDGV